MLIFLETLSLKSLLLEGNTTRRIGVGRISLMLLLMLST
uniref:Uncharacterized protein n=1 Tax=Brassica oleracea TaxID=3712 RepID=A0A3P6BXV7_BRAOL|nr:unnamed protein product [Brassica oleracea]